MSAAIQADARFALAASPARWGGRLGDVLVVLIPASAFVQLHVVGVLFAPDVLMLILFPFVLVARLDCLGEKLPRTLILLGVAWLAAQVATDLIRSTPFDDYARGWAKIGITLTNFTVIYALLYRDSRRVALYALGLAAGGILTYFLNPNAYAAGDPWEFGYGYGVILLVVLGASLLDDHDHHRLAIVLMIAAAAINLYHGFRSLTGECFLAGTYLIVRRFAHLRQRSGGRVSFAGACIAYAMLALAGTVVMRAYGYGASNGMFGYKQWQKYEIQSSGRYGVLVGGRIQFLVGLEAAAASPIVGHGSWAKDWRYQSRQSTLMERLGYRRGGDADSWVIPAHSHLVGAWVDAGIMGAAFWLWAFSLPCRVLARLYRNFERLAPLVAFLALVLIWDILLSPYGADRLFSTPFYLAVMMFSLQWTDVQHAYRLSGYGESGD